MKIREWWYRLKSQQVTDVIKHKHRFVVMDTDTFKEKFSFQLSGINLFVTVGISVIVLITLTSVLIAFTPLREWIPGYSDPRMERLTLENALRIDTLESQLEEQEWLISTLQAALRDEVVGQEFEEVKRDSSATLADAAEVYRRSKEDSLLRAEVEREDSRYQLRGNTSSVAAKETAPAISHLFFTPLKGAILRPFDALHHHAGIDIEGAPNQVVYSAYGGTVISAHFTAESGHVVTVQHPGNVVTVYRNNSVSLKHQGDVVRAGEPLAYVGNGGMDGKGYHLHFELWINGTPVNPEEYISFK